MFTKICISERITEKCKIKYQREKKGRKYKIRQAAISHLCFSQFSCKPVLAMVHFK